MGAKTYQVAECRNCKRERTIAADSLCRTCYSRWKRNGTFEKVRKRTFCRIVGCGGPTVSHGLCDKHRLRLREHGDPLKTLRPQDWGSRRKHPLYHRWRSARKQYGVVPAWEEFWQFVADTMPNRKTGTSRLYPLDAAKALGPGNYEWREPEQAQTRGAIAMRKSVARRGGHKAIDLMKDFGITVAQFEAMQAAQNNLCAICAQPERVFDKRFGKLRNLAVDHCHTTGKVRGLLCQSCNQGLGNFADDPTRLKAALDYLASHGVT